MSHTHISSDEGPTWATNEDGWPLAPEGYTFPSYAEVGSGAFAKVLQARCESKGEDVAVKVMALENITTSMEEIQTEVCAMKMNKHPNVLDLYCCFVVRSDLWLVMPLMDKGSCYYAMRHQRRSGVYADGQGFAEDVIVTIVRELLQGLAYIHGHQQIHRDIKAGNILINSRGRVAIADFGVAGWTDKGDRAGGASGGSSAAVSGGRKTFVGTPCWMAPEVMEQQKAYNQKADIWSVGITTLELAKGYAPYAKFPPMTVLLKTIRDPPPSLKTYVDGAASKLSEGFSKFVARCLQKTPSERPTAAELLLDPWLKKGLTPSRLMEAIRDVPPVVTLRHAGIDGGAAEGGGGDSAGDAFDGDGPEGSSVAGAGPSEFANGTTWSFPDEALGALRAGVEVAHLPAHLEEGVDEDEEGRERDIDDMAAELEELGGENAL